MHTQRKGRSPYPGTPARRIAVRYCPPAALARLASPQVANLRLRLVRYRLEVLALEPLAARGAVRDLLGVGFAPFPIVKKYPGVLSSGPPELPPDLGLLLARTIFCCG